MKETIETIKKKCSNCDHNKIEHLNFPKLKKLRGDTPITFEKCNLCNCKKFR